MVGMLCVGATGGRLLGECVMNGAVPCGGWYRGGMRMGMSTRIYMNLSLYRCEYQNEYKYRDTLWMWYLLGPAQSSQGGEAHARPLLHSALARSSPVACICTLARSRKHLGRTSFSLLPHLSPQPHFLTLFAVLSSSSSSSSHN
jgi:hypothetical protein